MSSRDWKAHFERKRRETAVIAATSTTAKINFGPATLSTFWQVERISVETLQGSGPVIATPTARVYIDSLVSLMDYSSDATVDISDETQPIHVGPGETLVIEFRGIGAGNICNSAIQFAEYSMVRSPTRARTSAALGQPEPSLHPDAALDEKVSDPKPQPEEGLPR